MSDQGYPGPDETPQDEQQPTYEQPTQPAYEPPPSYDQPPQPPYPPPPAYQQPPPYAPPPQQPQYGEPYYGDPQYPTTQYPTTQYPTTPYQYPAGAVPPQYPATPPAGGGGGRRGRWLSLAVGVLVALGVLGYFLLSGSNADAGTPKKAVSALLDAGKTGDLAAAKKALCRADANNAVLAALRDSGRIKTYAIDAVHTEDSTHAVVRARVTTTDLRQPTDIALPVVKEHGSWKVCPDPSSIIGSPIGPGGGSFPTPSGLPPITVPSLPITVPSIGVPNIPVPSGLPSVAVNPCGYAVGAEQAAITFVGLAELGQTNFAKACTWANDVSTSDIENLRAKTANDYFSPTGSSGPVVSFATIDGSKNLRVTMTKESDGKYYVTKVRLG